MKKITAFVLSVLVLLGTLTGCSGNADASACNVAVVAAIAENNPLFSAGIEELSSLPSLQNSAYCVISAESAPRVICDGEVPDLSGQGFTRAMLERSYAAIRADIARQLELACPASPEVDIAAAATMALRKLREHQREERENILVFYGSMISTCGLIDMTETPACELDVETSAAALQEELRWDMRGIRVVVYCCGDVAGEVQPSLSPNEVNTLKDFYTALFLAAGAESVEFGDFMPPEGCYDFDQSVSVMRTEGICSGLRPEVVECASLSADEIGGVFRSGGVLEFPEAGIAFQWNSAELEDTEAARNTLAEVVAYMREEPDFELLICGTTTSAGEAESCIRFSEERAGTIRALLVEAGISEERICTLGCGWSSCLYEPDRTPDGSLDESIAPRNRSVKLVGNDSAAADSIRASLSAR